MKIKILVFAILGLTLNLFAQNEEASAVPTAGTTQFVYSGIRSNGGGLAGFKLDPATGKLAEVPGSPVVLNSMGTSGALATAQGFIYIENLPSTAIGRIFQYKANATTGSVTLAHSTDFGIVDGNETLARLIASPNGNNLYGMFQSVMVSFGLNKGVPSVLGSVVVAQEQGIIWGFARNPVAPFAYAAIENGNPQQGFQPPAIELLKVAANGNLTDTGTAVAQLPNALPNGSNAVAVDPTGHFLVALNGTNDDELSVFGINSDGSLAEVPGSPFATGSSFGFAVHFDPTGRNIYLVDNNFNNSAQEDVKVFTINTSSGALTLSQSINLPSGFDVLSLKVEDNFVFVTNQPSSGIGTAIDVFKRASNGHLAQAAILHSNQDLSGTDTLHF